MNEELLKAWEERARLWAEGSKLWAEGDIIFIQKIIDTVGNVTIEWIYREDIKNYDCKLGDGSIFTAEMADQ